MQLHLEAPAQRCAADERLELPDLPMTAAAMPASTAASIAVKRNSSRRRMSVANGSSAASAI